MIMSKSAAGALLALLTCALALDGISASRLDAKKSYLPETTSFSIDGTELKGRAVDGQMGQCFSVPETKPAKVQVCGSEIKVMTYAMTRCGEYHTYQTQVGKCDPKLGSACDEVEFGEGTGYAPMSYQVVSCNEKVPVEF